MNRLYGVTMPEKGISKIVAVNLEKAEELVAWSLMTDLEDFKTRLKIAKSKLEKNNIKNGYCKYFNEYGGIKKEENYIDGKKEGSYKEYHNNGKLLLEENYKNGKLDGNRKLYNEDGHISDERNYKEGKREGIFWVYYPNGEYQYIDTYKNDKKINRKAYTVEGQLRFDQDYPQ